MNYERIIASGKTVFTVQDLLLLFDTKHAQTVRNFLQRAKKKGTMRQVRSGIWVLPDYTMYELANKVKKNSYVSCETVLKEAGAIFQYYGNTITSVSDNTVSKEVDGVQFIYRKIKDTILSNPIGVEYRENSMIASVERALCDMVYVSKHWYCDDLSMIDRESARNIAQIYSQRVQFTINQRENDRQSST